MKTTHNEKLSVQFTNLTPTQKETLQQMFAYMQKCSAMGATRTISFLWDAGWGMDAKIIFGKSAFNDDTPEKCKVPIDFENSTYFKNSTFFDLSEGKIGRCVVDLKSYDNRHEEDEHE